MRERSGIEANALRGKARLVLLAGWASLLGAVALPQPAGAQFFFWDRPRFSADDVARSVIGHGFRPLSRPVRNEGVYVADVVDRRGKHERLIVSADSGEIVQRFYVEYGSGVRRYADPTIPRGPVPPGRIPEEDSQPNIFSRLFSGDRDENATGMTPLVPDQNLNAPAEPRPPRIRRRPKVVERTPETVRPSTQIESAPLAPATPTSPAPAPAATSAPSQPVATAPDRPADAPPGSRPVRSITTNPLSLPGTREQDEKPAKATATAAPPAAAETHAEPPKPAAPKPAAKPAAPDVPVAPLD